MIDAAGAAQHSAAFINANFQYAPGFRRIFEPIKPYGIGGGTRSRAFGLLQEILLGFRDL
jgi:hypothetical protein